MSIYLTITSFLGTNGIFHGARHSRRLQLVNWLNDVSWYQDGWEVVAEKSRRHWWGQQVDLAANAWGMFLAIEGRRRKIPHLWAFMLLSQLVSLSYAQNLFYVALLLTPVPLPDNVRDLTRSVLPAHASW